MEVIVLIGLQGSGKSTFYKDRFGSTHAHVSRDNFRNNPNPARRQKQLIEEALKAERSVVVDNTNATKADRAAIIEIAQAHGVRVIGYYFAAEVKVCIARNHKREGKAKVPVVGILATKKRLEAPTLEEGFDALFHVPVVDTECADLGVADRPVAEQPNTAR